MVIKNPVPDEVLEFWFSGELMQLQPGQRIRVDDARGNHALSELGRRGLIKLEYGDETNGVEERRSEEGRRANLEFRRKQVIDFNQEQERRIQRKLAINEVPEHIKRYADQLGLKLFEPYTQTDEFTKEKAELIGKLQQAEEVAREKDASLQALRSEMDEMRQMMRTLMAAQAAPDAPAPAYDLAPMDTIDEEDLLQKLRTYNRASFQKWLAQNRDRLGLMPETVRKEVANRHERFFGQPLEAAAN
jgi:flagellar biosynthesis GTPase FlhF